MKYEKPNMDVVEFNENDIATSLAVSGEGQGTQVGTDDWW